MDKLELKDHFGVEVGDTVRFSCRREDEDGWVTERILRVTGVCFLIEDKHTDSDVFPKFHVRRSDGHEFWYYGDNIQVLKKARKNLALTIKQPWASLIVEGIKDIENRTWKTNFRGRIFVHAGADYPYVDLTDEQEDPICGDLRYNFIKRRFPISAIIGEVDIIDCVQNHPSIWAEHKATKIKTVDGVKTEVEVPVWNWVLANPVKYDQPILNIKGALSFWEFDREAGL